MITGGSGFVGINLFEYFKKKHLVKKVSVRYLAKQKIDVNADAIIHLAGKAHDLKNVSKPSDYYEANFELTKQVFDSFLESEATVFVFLSSVKAVADRINGVLTEDTIPNPKTHYGISKQQAEKYILSKELPYGKRIYIIRPCMIHGPGNKGNLNLLYNLVSRGIPWPLGSFENQRSFLSIENLCFVINEILENDSIISGIYNVADDEAISTNELILILSQSLGKRMRILKIPRFFINGISKMGDFLKLPLNSERLQKLTENYVVSNQKIVKTMRKPLPVAVDEGLINTFKSLKVS